MSKKSFTIVAPNLGAPNNPPQPAPNPTGALKPVENFRISKENIEKIFYHLDFFKGKELSGHGGYYAIPSFGFDAAQEIRYPEELVFKEKENELWFYREPTIYDGINEPQCIVFDVTNGFCKFEKDEYSASKSNRLGAWSLLEDAVKYLVECKVELNPSEIFEKVEEKQKVR